MAGLNLRKHLTLLLLLCLCLCLCLCLTAAADEPKAPVYGAGWDVYATSSGIALDGDTLYMTWPSKAGAVERVLAVIDAAKPAQAYWCWGWPMNGLIKLYGATGEQRYLDGAVRIYDFLAGCHEHAFHFTTAGKDGWGSSMLYRITGDDRYLKTAMSQMEFILSRQHSDGYMLGPDANSFDDQPLRTTYDFTADFGSWLVGVAIELAGKEQK